MKILESVLFLTLIFGEGVFYYLNYKIIRTSRKIVFYDNFVSFWMRHSKHLRQLGCIIPNIYVTLDHFPVALDISCHFGQCHKRPCFLLVTVGFIRKCHNIKRISLLYQGVFYDSFEEKKGLFF